MFTILPPMFSSNGLSPSQADYVVASRRRWMALTFPLIFLLVACYLAFVAIGSRLMRRRKGSYLNRPLILWNFGLAAFNIWAAVISSRTTLSRWHDLGFRDSLCSVGTMFHGLNGDVVWYFALSKMLEMGDTAFLILRKRPVSILHWYHHSTVLLFAWYQFLTPTAPSQWGVTINAIVHSFMYPYFMVKAIGFWLPKWVSICVTTIQLTQFVVGGWMSWVSFEAVVLGAGGCVTSRGVAILQSVLCLTYIVLFSHFFYVSYCLHPQSRPEQQGKANGDKTNWDAKQENMYGKGARLKNDFTGCSKRQKNRVAECSHEEKQQTDFGRTSLRDEWLKGGLNDGEKNGLPEGLTGNGASKKNGYKKYD